MSEEREPWDGVDRRAPRSDFQVKTWGDIQSLITIAVVMIGGIAWGLKLEARIDALQNSNVIAHQSTDKEIAEIRTALAKGVLPITEVRLNNLEDKVRLLSNTVDECVGKSRRTALEITAKTGSKAGTWEN